MAKVKESVAMGCVMALIPYRHAAVGTSTNHDHDCNQATPQQPYLLETNRNSAWLEVAGVP